MPSDAVFDQFPGLGAFADRHFDAIKLNGVSFPETTRRVIDLSQATKRCHISNHYQIVTPKCTNYLADACRLIVGQEAMAQREIHFGHRHPLLDAFSSRSCDGPKSGDGPRLTETEVPSNPFGHVASLS